MQRNEITDYLNVLTNGEEIRPVIVDGIIIPGYFVSRTGDMYTNTKFVRKVGTANGFVREVSMKHFRKMRPSPPAKNKDHLAVILSIPNEVREDYNYSKSSKNSLRKMKRYVHQIVMDSFKPIDENPPEQLKDTWNDVPEEWRQWVKDTVYIDHIDTQANNNHADNLRYVTPRENARAATKHYGGNSANKVKLMNGKIEKKTNKTRTIVDFM